MKKQIELPAAVLTKSADRRLPSGSGVLIGIAASFVFWAALAVVLALHV